MKLGDVSAINKQADFVSRSTCTNFHDNNCKNHTMNGVAPNVGEADGFSTGHEKVVVLYFLRIIKILHSYNR